jgi:hypothetical protein
MVAVSKFFVPEPEIQNHLHFSEIDDVSFLECSLASVASQVSLGDTNTAVPGRLLGRIEAYQLAGASDYILETVRFGYKLVFMDGKPPLLVTVQTTKPP